MITLRLRSPHTGAVKVLQRVLGLDLIDGDFGLGTLGAVKRFQSKYDLDPDGVVGFSTWRKLFIVYASKLAQRVEHKLPRKPKAKVKSLLALWGYSSRSSVEATFDAVLPVITPHLRKMRLDLPEYWIAFASTIREETGNNFKLVENLNYSCRALPNVFGYYRRERKAANVLGVTPVMYIHGRCRNHPADQIKIANHAYANRMGNRSPQSGDGWRNRGSGVIQLTGEENKQAYHDWLKSDFPDLYEKYQGSEILTQGANLLQESPHNILTGVHYWLTNELYKGVDQFGLTREGSDYITNIVNPATSSKHKRFTHMQKAKSLYSGVV